MCRVVVVAQLIKRLLPIPEIRRLNPVLGICTQLHKNWIKTVQKHRKKTSGIAQFKKKLNKFELQRPPARSLRATTVARPRGSFTPFSPHQGTPSAGTPSAPSGSGTSWTPLRGLSRSRRQPTRTGSPCRRSRSRTRDRDAARWTRSPCPSRAWASWKVTASWTRLFRPFSEDDPYLSKPVYSKQPFRLTIAGNNWRQRDQTFNICPFRTMKMCPKV